MGQLLEIPVPRTEEGAHKLGLALDAQLRAERWALRRRRACLLALVAGGLIAVDATFAVLAGAIRRALIAGWWVALAATAVAATVEVWSTARLYRIVEEIRR